MKDLFQKIPSKQLILFKLFEKPKLIELFVNIGFFEDLKSKCEKFRSILELLFLFFECFIVNKEEQFLINERELREEGREKVEREEVEIEIDRG